MEITTFKSNRIDLNEAEQISFGNRLQVWNNDESKYVSLKEVKILSDNNGSIVDAFAAAAAAAFFCSLFLLFYTFCLT